MRKLIIDDNVKQSISKVQSEHDFRKETGGILVGFYDTDREALRITDMSFAYPSDHGTWLRFSRNSQGHQEFVDNLWVNSGHTKAYLGEWHTHDQSSPIPSMTDRSTWKRISKRNNNFDQCYFMIIGREQHIIWTVVDGKIIEVDSLGGVI